MSQHSFLMYINFLIAVQDDNDMLVGEEWKELNGKKQGNLY